jgi:3-dehydrotetronate 4-kinase
MSGRSMLQLGCIADDFTGATDLANNLVRAGMRVVQTIGVPEAGSDAEALAGVDAVVVALKSRTAPVAEAVSQSLAAARWLREQGAQRFYFKVCSTFDSTAQGNIGPVAEALMAMLDAPFVPVTPAFPENGRTIFQGHLFVGEQLLSDSPMRHHPLTPMTDANLMRVLQPQLATHRVGLVARAVVAQGADAIAARAHALVQQGIHFGVVDAVDNADLHPLAAAIRAQDWPLVVAGSGLAIAMPATEGFSPSPSSARLPRPSGAAAVVSGSCSAATNAQVAAFAAAGGAALPIDALRLARGEQTVDQILAWALPRLGDVPILVHATAPPDTVRAVQAELGVERAGALVEQALADVARALVAQGVRRLVVAGGETSGACVQALGIRRLRIGAQIDPGVPWCHDARLGLHLALKSGNFGGVDFFHRAFTQLAQDTES